LLDLFFPRDDLLRGMPVEQVAGDPLYLPQDAESWLRFIRDPLCPVCGYPLWGGASGDEPCEKCRHLEPFFEGNRSVLLLNPLSRRLVHELKYHGALHLLADIRWILERGVGLGDWVDGGQLVPVPLHPSRLKSRGYNQSLLFAREVAALREGSQVEVVEALDRVVATQSQTRMDRRSRMRNVEKAFVLRNDCGLDPRRLVILVDDVFTTGATVNACARVLAKAGFLRIRVLTLGHG
jgi:ComF family protein